MKNLKIRCSIILLMMTALISCSQKDEPKPDVKEDPTEQEPGTPATAPIELDKSFVSSFGTAGLSAMQKDGKIVIVSQNGTKIFRVDKNGGVDKSFDVDQDKTWSFGIESMALQPDGKVILGGVFRVDGNTYNIVRLTQTGLLDRTFKYHQAKYYSGSYVSFMDIYTVFSQVDGKIIFNVTSTMEDFGHILRLNADGSIDPTFNEILTMSNEILTIIGTRETFLSGIVQLPDGKIIMSGDVSFIDKKSGGIADRKYVAKFNPDGLLDKSFKYTCTTPVNSIAVQGGKILCGHRYSALTDAELRNTQYPYAGLFRLNADGSVDNTFQTTTLNVNPIDIAVKSDNSFFTISDGATGSASTLAGKRFTAFTADGKLGESLQVTVHTTDELRRVFKQSEQEFVITGSFHPTGASLSMVRLKVQ
jgi:uncharacterized delta-60 repeat protein